MAVELHCSPRVSVLGSVLTSLHHSLTPSVSFAPLPISAVLVDSASGSPIAFSDTAAARHISLSHGGSISAATDFWLDCAAQLAHCLPGGASSGDLDAVLEKIEKHMTGKNFLVGEAFSVADACLWAALRGNARMRNTNPSKFANALRWFSSIEQSPNAKRAEELLKSAHSASPAMAPMAAPPKNDRELMARLNTFVRNGLLKMGVKESDIPERLSINAPPSEKSDAGKDVDYCIGVFDFHKVQGKGPNVFAADLAKVLPEVNPAEDLVSKVTTFGPYVNFTLKVQGLAAAALGVTFDPNPEPDTGRHLLVEFSSPNTNKPQHFGHVRNNLLGNATSNILKWAGIKVTRVNLINDRGIHICKSMLAYQLFGKGETPESSGIKGDHLVGKYYVTFETKFREEYAEWLKTDAAKEREQQWWKTAAGLKMREKAKAGLDKINKMKDEDAKQKALEAQPKDWDVFKTEYKEDFFNGESNLGRQAKEMLVKWEASDPEVRKLWTTMNSWVLAGFTATYKMLGIEFDRIDYESVTYVLGKEIVQDGLAKGVLVREPNGAVSCDLPTIGLTGMGKKILLRSDGTSVYMTQDLGTAYKRYDELKPTGLVYVVACEQDDHFRILFKILGSIRPELDGKCYHLSYGMVNVPEGRMKSREGTVVDADDQVSIMREESEAVVKEKWPGLSEAAVKERAVAIARAALNFMMLSISPKSTMTFDPKKSVDFTGKTGPYMLYTYARARKVLRDAGFSDNVNVDAAALVTLSTDMERYVAQSLLQCKVHFRTAAELYEPSRVVDGIYNVARSFNSMYNDKAHPILKCEDAKLKQSRLLLTAATAHMVKQGLALLGIPTLEEM
eukprot:comp21590_c0_seq1/m.47496 comp21590_c0_seq1/g.47496  ORF comp21590_c0_seq1/g.47496 comp21590_c0_seq1/m.47496 type:complete len:846 (-) comp21590_c0_seq1:102-2639(-)